MHVRIITDDFTSALDGTACFAERGWDTAVMTQPDDVVSASVVSLDTDTREHRELHAGDVVAASTLVWRDADVLVLQFDSTLRGRIVSDCLEARAASGRSRLLIAPAFPAAGRTTESGCVLVHGVPVHRTVFGRDPTLPVAESSIPALFARHGVSVEVARDAADARKLVALHEVVVVDARTEEDLDALAESFADRDDLLWAGSTGVLRALARTMPVPSGTADARRGVPIANRPWLVVGSLHPSSRRQLEVVRAQRGVNVLATSAVRLPKHTALVALHEIVQQATSAIRRGACDGLVVTGGETARRIVETLPALSLCVSREVMPGVALAELTAAGGSLPLITKAGGFGDEDALVTCIDMLAGARRDR
jgi:uncharacterized protein YgbK (DUF1537 family)